LWTIVKSSRHGAMMHDGGRSGGRQSKHNNATHAQAKWEDLLKKKLW
jgi:hypothetical protein